MGISARTVEPLIGERTTAIVPVHLFGNPAPMDELRELAAARNLRLLEDAAQAAGGAAAGTEHGNIRRCRGFQLLPLQEPARDRRRRRIGHERSRCGCDGTPPAGARPSSTAAVSTRSRVQLAARRGSGGRPARRPAPSRGVDASRRDVADWYAEQGLENSSICQLRRQGPSHASTST